MQWNLITVGRPSLRWAREAAEDYLARLQHYASVDWIVIKEGPPSVVEQKILAVTKQSLVVVLDERGRSQRSKELAHWIERQDLASEKRASIIIGGADGHTEAIRRAARECWTLSSFTLQHEVALVVLLEQLYRAYTIIKREPYHRE